MITFPGYQIYAQIYESATSAIYRGVRERDKHPVIFKVIKSEYPTPLELERYQKEYKILRNLDIRGVVKAYGLEFYQRTVALILEDFGGQALSDLMGDRSVAGGDLSLREFLKFAIEIVTIVGEIHRSGAIHKDLNLANIGLNPQTGELKIFDFSIAILAESEELNSPHFSDLQGTPAYISPEQTGRIDRAIDYRTDFYALGVVFYHLLSGRLPFATTDLLEMVHCHLAKQPPSLESQAGIPQVLADLVMKLLAKNPQERYQNAWGIRADLVKALQQLEEKGRIDRFGLAEEDVCERLSFSEQLYGRESELQVILNAFDRMMSLPTATSQTDAIPVESILLSGDFGIGKSALLQEVFNRLVTTKHCHCLSIKCDSVQVHIPFSTLLNLLRGLARQVLMDNQERIECCRQQLLAILGDRVAALVAAIPELKSILETVESIQSESQSRHFSDYTQLFPCIFRVLARAKTPLVVLIDDWQWVDSASLKLMEVLMRSPLSSPALPQDRSLVLDRGSDGQLSENIQANERVLWVGTYQKIDETRDDEVMSLFRELDCLGTQIFSLTLSPLDTQHIERILARILYCEGENLEVLAKVVERKTGGNPFFIREFLKKLNSTSAIYFDAAARQWKWNLSQIEAMDLTENLVEFTMANFMKLPSRTRQILGYAACIGVEFDLNTLSAIANCPGVELFSSLVCALQSELIFTIPNPENRGFGADTRAYKFGHDRIHKLAYSTLEESQKSSVHFAIGRFWLHENPQRDWVECHFFQIVNQLYLGADRIVIPAEREEVVKLHLKAGRKSKLSMDLAGALEYFNRGVALSLPHNPSRYLDELRQEVAEILTLQSFFEQSDRILNLSIEFFCQGKNIDVLKRDIDCYLKLACDQHRFNETLSYIQGVREELAKFTGESFEKNSVLFAREQAFGYSSFKLSTLQAQYQVFQCQLTYVEDRPEEALTLARSVSKAINYIFSIPLTIAYLFYYTLTLVKLYPTASEPQRNTFWKQIELNTNQLKLWSDAYPDETTHKICLIEAEIARLSDRFLEALEGYERAIDLARENQAIHEEAIAYELAARFYLAWGKKRQAQTYFKEAHYAYTRWGATEKVKQLERNYPPFIKSAWSVDKNESYELKIQLETTTESPTSVLDLATVMKASHAISTEICLEQFLLKSLDILMENAGAQRGFLILPRDSTSETSSELRILVQSTVQGQTFVLPSLPLDWIPAETELPLVSSAIVNYVARTQESVVLECAVKEGNFTTDFYIQKARIQSVLCDPLLYQGQLVGVVYMENNLTTGAFTPERLQVVRLLSQQAAIALENATLYDRLEEYSHTLEARVEQRTHQLQQEIIERQLLETRLRSEERKMRAIFEAMTDIILIVKLNENGIENIDIAPTCPTCESAPTLEIIDQTVERFFQEESDWETPVRQVLETQKILNFDYELVLEDKPIWFTASISPIPGGSVIWVARNITDRVLAEQALRLSEETFSKSFSASPSAITITRLADGKHVEVNETFCNLTGYTPEEVIGKTAVELNLWVNSEDRKNLFKLLDNDGIVRNYEFDFRTKAGQIFTALLSVEIVHIRGEDCLIAISNDITDRKQAEKAIHQKNEELARTLAQLQATQDELIQSERMASLGQLIAGVAHEINTPMGAIRASIDNISKSLEGALTQLPHIFQTLSPERISDFLVLLEVEQNASQVFSFREERKLKRSLSSELERRGIDQADTLAATLVSLGITQDIEWLMPLLQDGDRDSILDTAENLSILQKNSENIKLAVERASKIVFALKTYSRQGNTGHMSQVSITEGIELVLTIYRNHLKHGIETIKHYETIPLVYCFPEELNQVWTNLIHNAIYAMNDRGILEIHTCQKERFVLVKVTDSGCGISQDIQQKIFDPFFTTKPSGEGTGLGLNIVRKIIDKHHGKIEVESRPGRTTFSVWLPVDLPQ